MSGESTYCADVVEEVQFDLVVYLLVCSFCRSGRLLPCEVREDSTLALSINLGHILCYDAPLLWIFGFVLYICKHVHDNECSTVPESFPNQQVARYSMTLYVVSMDTVGHITHLQQPIVARELAVGYSRSDTRQPVGLWSKKGGYS
jgi:hypothetical protein